MNSYSVLMTVYKNDSAEFFCLSVESMLKQTLKTDDFVLVCDGELSNELNECIEKYSRNNKDVFQVIRLEKNVGLGEALRIGLPYCKNELVARMDDDDIAKLNRCEIEYKYMMKNKGISILGSYMNEFDSDPDSVLRVKKVPIGNDNILKYSRRRNPFNHSTIMFRKDDVISAGNYSTMRTNQDVELWVRMLNLGYKGNNINLSLVDFRFDNNTYSRRKDFKNIKLLLKVWNNFMKKGYCNQFDLVYVFVIQIIMFIVPSNVLKWLYNNFR